jgi:type II protein arginine methyltransferase
MPRLTIGPTATVDREEIPARLRPFFDAVRDRPDLLRRLALMLRTLAAKLDAGEAQRLAERLRAGAPDDALVWSATETIIRAAVPQWHFAIIRDERRNSIYDKALRAAVTPEKVVLEIGTGSGILAMMAARAGARHVYTIEVQPLIAEAARRNIADNGYAERITVINKDALRVQVGEDLPRPCDLLVHEVVSNDLLSESVLPLVAYARSKLLTPDAGHLPHRIAAHGMLIGDDVFGKGRIAGAHVGLTLTAMDVFGTWVRKKNGPMHVEQPLSRAEILLSFDLARAARDEVHSVRVPLQATADGVARGLLQWISFTFPDGSQYENGPDTSSNWALCLHPFPRPVNVAAGQTIMVPVEARDSLLVVGQPVPGGD